MIVAHQLISVDDLSGEDELTRDGYTVRMVQNATESLTDDAAATRQILDGVDGDAVLVGHSYGGAVMM